MAIMINQLFRSQLQLHLCLRASLGSAFTQQVAVKGWINVQTDDAAFRYEQAAEWAGLLGWEVTHFFTDDQADPLIDNIFSCLLVQ